MKERTVAKVLEESKRILNQPLGVIGLPKKKETEGGSDG